MGEDGAAGFGIAKMNGKRSLGVLGQQLMHLLRYGAGLFGAYDGRTTTNC